MICFATIAGSVVRVSFRSILFFLKCPFLIVSDLLRNNVLYNLMSCSTHSDPQPVNASQTKVKFRGRIGYITLSLYIMVYAKCGDENSGLVLLRRDSELSLTES